MPQIHLFTETLNKVNLYRVSFGIQENKSFLMVDYFIKTLTSQV